MNLCNRMLLAGLLLASFLFMTHGVTRAGGGSVDRIGGSGEHAGSTQDTAAAIARSTRQAWIAYRRMVWDLYLHPGDAHRYLRNRRAYILAYQRVQEAIRAHRAVAGSTAPAFSGWVRTRGERGARVPVARAEILVWADRGEENVPTLADPPRARSLSGADGTFAISGLAPGNYITMVRRAGFRSDQGKLVLTGRPVRREILLESSRARTVEGTAFYVDEDTLDGPLRARLAGGKIDARLSADIMRALYADENRLRERLKPLAGADVTAECVDPSGDGAGTSATVARATTGERGAYTMPDLSGDSYRLRISSPGFIPFEDVEVVDEHDEWNFILVRRASGFDDLNVTSP